MYPEELKYHKEHTWAQVSDGTAKIGITDYAQESLGDIVYVELPSIGDEVTANEPLGEVESTKAVSKIYSPVAGTVTAINDDVVDAPEQMNEDPHGAWLVEVEMSDESNLDKLMDSSEYESFIAEQA